MRLVLGIDTSNYTTSLCAIDYETGECVAEERKLLPVEHGERGLRQSDALFFHVQQIPYVMDLMMTNVRRKTSDVTWAGVGVSVRPRPAAQSYMPVFRAGDSYAATVSRMQGIPVVRTSHQEGHLAAAQFFIPDMASQDPFIAVHISGGTSDILYAVPTRHGYCIETLAEGADLHAGQFVDRVGVAMGLPFPAGPHLEKLAQTSCGSEFRVGGRLVGGRLSFSGPCSAALRAVDAGVPRAAIARAVENCVANMVVKGVENAYELYPQTAFCVIAGGVASNEYIRTRIHHRLKLRAPKLLVKFAPPRYSSDNALGVASIARKFLRA